MIATDNSNNAILGARKQLSIDNDRKVSATARSKAAWMALENHGQPPKIVDYSGCGCESEARWCKMGGKLADYHAITNGKSEHSMNLALGQFTTRLEASSK